MIKKYAPFLVLLIAGFLLFYVKQHQRGASPATTVTVNPQVPSEVSSTESEVINRHPAALVFTRHARCRMECRHITEAEIRQVIETGTINQRKIQEDERGKTYPIEGKAGGGKQLRIVVAPKKSDLVVVTVIDLDTEWPCDCH